MPEQKKVKCRQCGQTRSETVPGRTHCPKCGRPVGPMIPFLPEADLRPRPTPPAL